MPSYFRFPSQEHNIQTFRAQPFSEISGSLGDLGTLLPLLLALAINGSINLPTTLVFTGLSNIITGLYFGIPLPVQPMKAIAAVAIANRFSVQETTSAGIFVGAVILAASVTGLINWIGRVVPIPVVKGIQVGAGISLAMSGGEMIKATHSWWIGADSKVMAFIAFLFLLLTTRPAVSSSVRSGVSANRIPFALIVFVIGFVLALFVASVTDHGLPFFISIWSPRLYIPNSDDYSKGILTAGLGQLPLTTLNSIIAVTHLSADILPSPPYPEAPSFTKLGVSVGIMNLVACWFGAMPVCHGSGGLAGQVRFGARSGASVILLGITKLILGLFVSGSWLISVLDHFPRSLLGVMVIGCGLELAKVGESLNMSAKDLMIDDENGTKHSREVFEQERLERWSVMMVTVAMLLAFKNDAIGFLAGLLCHWTIRSPEYLRRRPWRAVTPAQDE